MKKTIVVTGIKDIDRRLRRLEPKIQKKVLRTAMRDGMKVVAEATRNNVPVDTGLTRKSVKVKAGKRQANKISLLVQVSGKVPGLIKHSKSGKRAFYPAIVEFGRKGVAPNPFMRRAFESKGEAARQKTIQSIRDGVEKAIKSL